MKSKEYVAYITKLYRILIDKYYNNEDLTITNEVAEKGMTLEEWTNSKYNTRNIKVVDMERAMSDENYMMSFVDGKCIDYSSFVEYDYLVEAFGSDLKEGKLTKNGNCFINLIKCLFLLLL